MIVCEAQIGQVRQTVEAREFAQMNIPNPNRGEVRNFLQTTDRWLPESVRFCDDNSMIRFLTHFFQAIIEPVCLEDEQVWDVDVAKNAKCTPLFEWHRQGNVYAMASAQFKNVGSFATVAASNSFPICNAAM